MEALLSRESPAAAVDAPVVSINDVTHRYGATLALDCFSLDIPKGRMVGVIGPDGVGKSTLLALVAGSKKNAAGQSDGAWRRHRRRGPQARRLPAHRLHAPGPRQESLFRTQRAGECRLHGAAVRPFRRGAPRAHQAVARCDGSWTLSGAPRRQALGRHETEGRFVRRARARAGPAHPRRTDHRRGPAVAPPVLVAHRRHPRRPAQHERRHLHRLYGRGPAMGLDRRHGRRARARDGHAGGAHGANGNEGS